MPPRRFSRWATAVWAILWGLQSTLTVAAEHRSTEASIQGQSFFINGKPTYAGRTWNGHRIEGLLFNARLVQGIFDDLNPKTVGRWAYPDTGRWDPDRNTREFVAAMPQWRRQGLLAFTINLQGGNPQGYSPSQPWRNSAITPDGALRADSMARLKRILDRADELGMVVILGLFYFGQDEGLRDEAAVVRAAISTQQGTRKRMKIALPSNGTEVDEHFGHCQCFTIFGVDDENKIISEEVLTPPPGCGCKSNIVPQLAGIGVSVMLAGNMGGGAVNILASNGIKVIRGCTGNVHELARAWLAGRIQDSGAGCQSHGPGGCPEHS